MPPPPGTTIHVTIGPTNHGTFSGDYEHSYKVWPVETLLLGGGDLVIDVPEP